MSSERTNRLRRVLIRLQLENPGTDDLQGNQDPCHEPHEIRRAIQDPAADPKEGKRWQRAEL